MLLTFKVMMIKLINKYNKKKFKTINWNHINN